MNVLYKGGSICQLELRFQPFMSLITIFSLLLAPFLRRQDWMKIESEVCKNQNNKLKGVKMLNKTEGDD